MLHISSLLLIGCTFVALAVQQSVPKTGGVNMDSSNFKRPRKTKFARRELLSYTLPTVRTVELVPLKKTELDSDFSDQDPCKLSRPCRSNGQCINTDDGYYCACPPTHYGKLCEYMVNDEHCAMHQCVNNATCYSVETERRVVHGDIDQAFLVRYECFCPPGFIGAFCEFSESARICEQDHCLHHGIAFRSKHVELAINCICVCEPFYYGERCQYVSLCKNFVCHNEGVCEEIVHANGERSARCVCPQGVRLFEDAITITGDHCEHILYSGSRRSLRWCLPCDKEATVDSARNCLRYLEPFPPAQVFNGFHNLGGDDFCFNGATCYPTLSNVSDEYGNSALYLFAGCNCTDQLTYGLFCEHKRASLCEMKRDEIAAYGSENRCMNGGRCIVDASINTWRCECLSGYTGQICEVKDPCKPNPCKSGAVCVRIPETISQRLEFDHACLCDMDQDVDPDSLDCIDTHYDKCASHPCAPGSACFPCDLYGDKELLCDEVEQMQGFHCVCKPGTDGLLCDKSWDSCSTRPCLFGGRCVPLSRFEYRCECTPGYNGTTCEHIFDICLVKGGRCVNGKCSVDASVVRGFRCDCYDGFDGHDCEIDIGAASLSVSLSRWGFVVWPAIMFVTVFPMMTFAVYWRERRARKGLPLLDDQRSSNGNSVTMPSQPTTKVPITDQQLK